MKKILFFTVLITSLFIIKNLVVSIYSLWQKQDLIVQAQKELETEKKKHESLKKEVAKASSPFYLEEQARNKLFMVKPGESSVVLPKLTASTSGVTPQAQKKANWQLWRELFF